LYLRIPQSQNIIDREVIAVPKQRLVIGIYHLHFEVVGCLSIETMGFPAFVGRWVRDETARVT
jgi:hypothetical protein